MATGPDDPFERIARTRSAAGAAPAPRETGDVVSPVPADAPPRLARHSRHGEPSTVWTYCDASGAALFHTARFDTADGSKVVLPLTLWRVDGALRWAWKALPDRRPLYGLQELVARPRSPVLIVEGEKTADAARRTPFATFVVVTWPGGSKAAGKVDWTPLAGRDVVIFPDADEPGRRASQDVARRAISAGAVTAGVVSLPATLPDGWDLADPWAPGFGLAEATAAIETARELARPGGVEWPFGFRMERDGFFYDQPMKEGRTFAVWLSEAFETLGEGRDQDGAAWSIVLRFRDRDGREKVVPVSRSRLAGGSAEVRADLADAGLVVSPARGRADKFADALARVKCARRVTLVAATGWCGDRFIIPGRPVGAPGGEQVLFTGEASALRYGQAGTLAGWQSGVGAVAEGNHLLTFALSLAFVGPMLRLLEIEGGGVHFRGPSSCGKTTLAHAAGSVWGGGGPLGFGQTWRTTSNALEMVAYGHNDGLAVLDELALVAPEEAGAAAYSLASGQSKARAKTDGSLRKRSEWRVSILSTGEIGLADHISASRKGDRPMAGQELRLLDIAADAGKGMGVWEVLHDRSSPAALSDAVRHAGARDFGHAGPAFLERLIADRDWAIANAKEMLAAFLKLSAEPGDTGQAQRAAVRFGAIAAAGELAAAAGVAPWAPGSAAMAALVLYRRWARSFGRSAPREEQEILLRLKGCIESEKSAFSPVGDRAKEVGEESEASESGRDGEARGLKTYGYRQIAQEGLAQAVRYYFHDDGWRRLMKGFNPEEAARTVDAAGFLEKDARENRLKKSVKIRGEKHRLYCVRSSILEASFD